MAEGKLMEEKKQKRKEWFNETIISCIRTMEGKRKRGKNDRG